MIERLAEEYRKSKPVNRAKSARALDSTDHGEHREYQYRPAYDDFGYSPVKSTNGRLSNKMRAIIQARLDDEKAKGLPPSASSVEDWWEKKKERTRLARNKRRRLARAKAKEQVNV